MEDLKTLDAQLNALIAKGEMIEAVQKFYADDCEHQEGNNPPRTGGKVGQVQYLTDFFKTVTAVNGLTLRSSAVGDGVTFSEWSFDLTTTGGPILWNEVMRRHWLNGKVISERFYTAPSV